MKYFPVILCFFASLTVKAQQHAAFKKEKIAQCITWQSDRQLQWTDFKGKPLDSKPAAQSFTEINLVTETDEKGNITFQVTANFFPDKSYVNKKALYNDHILNHEQMHFNMAELYAREIRKTIAHLQNTKDAGKIEEVNNIFDRLSQQYNKAQDIYDNETNHSIHKENQDKWNRAILGQLENLHKYAETKIDNTISKRQ